MKIKVTILTGDRDYGQRLRTLLNSHFEIPIGIVRDESDFSLRALSQADLILLGNDLTRQRILMVLRALRILRPQSRTIALLQSKEALDQMLDYLSHGVWAIVLEDERQNDLMTAARQVLHDRRFLSPLLLTPIIARYRELCAELRRTSGHASIGSRFQSR